MYMDRQREILVCVCVCERERSVCVCFVCVCVCFGVRMMLSPRGEEMRGEMRGEFMRGDGKARAAFPFRLEVVSLTSRDFLLPLTFPSACSTTSTRHTIS